MKYLLIILVLLIPLIIFFSIQNKNDAYVTPLFDDAQLKTIKAAGNVTELWEFSGTKDYILLVSGGPGVPTYLYPVAKYLNVNGYNVVMYNQRGTGNSINTDKIFGLSNYVEDIERIRKELNIDSFHMLGHSWGGLLSQLYFSKYPENVKSLFLSNSAIGTGSEWQAMEKKVMHYNQVQSTTLGWVKLGGLSGTSLIPGNIGNLSSRSMMNQVWKNYFENPKNIKNADKNWLNGIFSTTINKTRKSIIDTPATEYKNEGDIPITILYGENDIYGKDYSTIFKRFSGSINIILNDSRHLPWVQNEAEYFALLGEFYGSEND